MKCPHCTKEIHFQATQSHAYQNNPDSETDLSGFDVSHGFCPSCEELIVLVREGVFEEDSDDLVIQNETIVYPKIIAIKKLTKEIPSKYTKEYEEAATVLPFSPKASAAISRRLLQAILHEESNIKARNLEDEIAKFIERKDLPSYIADAVDAIRNIGNFAAHPIKNTNTGEIVDVEPGEAEWLINVLEDLFDFAFVQPEKLRKRKEELNSKLEALGKKPMRGSDSKDARIGL
jgi:hypothetical protein